MRRMLGSIRQTITFVDFCKLIQNIVSMDVQKCRALMMTLVADVNKDAQVDSSDLFKLLQLCNHSELASKMLLKDIKTIINVLDANRDEQGKADLQKIRLSALEKRRDQARDQREVIVKKRNSFGFSSKGQEVI